jgi:hypothetical protein
MGQYTDILNEELSKSILDFFIETKEFKSLIKEYMGRSDKIDDFTLEVILPNVLFFTITENNNVLLFTKFKGTEKTHKKFRANKSALKDIIKFINEIIIETNNNNAENNHRKRNKNTTGYSAWN